MPAVIHILLIAGYGLFAAMAAIVLPLKLPGLEAQLGIGIALFVLAASLHQTVAKNSRDAKRERALGFKERIDGLATGNDKFAKDIAAMREENRLLNETLAEVARTNTEQRQRESEAERRALQELKAQIAAMKAAEDKRARDLEAMREESRALRDNLKEMMHHSASAEPQLPETETERRVLQELERQISEVPLTGSTPGGATTVPVGEKPRKALTLSEAKILNIVREGLKQDRVDLFLQPIVKLPQRTRRFYECYSRIRSADGTMVTPAQYIELARDHGLLGAIDNILLFRCVQLVRKAQRHNHNLGFFCNISIQTLGDRKFFPQFIAFMEENRKLASRLIFEFAEEDIDSQWQVVAEDLQRLSSLGFNFSMDRVKHMGFDPALMASRHFKFVKVTAETILSRSHDGGKNLQLLKQELDRNSIDLIVEKVETQDQLMELNELGIYFAQGFLFGEPRLSRKD
jgi:cyclic-di-GMP phosphodiesterase TipF (flagellum assembly factor)